MAIIEPQVAFLNDDIGRVLPNAKIYSYEIDDENTPKPLYLDKNFNTLAPYPVQATADGVFPQIYGDGKYLLVYKDENDVRLHNRDIDSTALTEGEGGILTTPTNGVTIAESDPDLILLGGLWDVSLSGANAPTGIDSIEVQPIRGMMLVINQDGDGDTYQRFYSNVTGVTYESNISDRDGGGDRAWFEQVSSQNLSSFTTNFAIANGTQSYTGDKTYTSGTITYNGSDVVFDAAATLTVGDMTTVAMPKYGPFTVAVYAAFNGPVGLRDLTAGGVDRDIANIGGVFEWSGEIKAAGGTVWTGLTMQPTTADGLNVMRNMKYTAVGALADNATTGGANVSFVKFDATSTIVVTSAATGTWKNVSGGTINQNDTGMFIKTA